MSDNDQDVNMFSESSTETGVEVQTAKSVPLDNRIAEVNRRLSKLDQSMQKIQQMFSAVQPADKAAVQATYPVEDTSEGYMTKGEYYKQRDSEEYEKIKSVYPELDQQSDTFDSEFFQLADVYYQEFSTSKTPMIRKQAVQKAVQQAALETGKFQQLERSKALSDEARRSRLLGEGTTAPKGVQKDAESEVSSNVKTLAKLFGVDDKKLKHATDYATYQNSLKNKGNK